MSLGGEGDEEQRVHPRVRVSGSASIRVLGETGSQTAKLVDLSRSGVLLATPLLAVGARVRLDTVGLQTTGTVVRQVDACGPDRSEGVAIRFDELQNLDWSRIRRRGADW
ncbi:MAG: PilZ domain-containing protein [Thermoanaerobaculia bacterium]|nr:PilZ domain-containing protein [Thermoanaerobaculia bacterium]